MKAPGPLSLLAACILPVCGAFAIHSWQVGLLGIAAELGLLGWLVTDWRGALRRASLGLVAALSIFITTWIYGGHELGVAVGAGSRILYIVLPTALVGARIRPSELGDHLTQRLHLPARPVTSAVVALQQLEQFGNQWQQIQRARRIRGLGLDGNPLNRLRGSAAGAFALLLSSLRQASEMSIAMDARGFANATDRTWAGAAQWRSSDWLILVIGCVLAALPWWLAIRI